MSTRPPRDSPEYAAFKAQKRANRAAKKLEQEAAEIAAEEQNKNNSLTVHQRGNTHRRSASLDDRGHLRSSSRDDREHLRSSSRDDRGRGRKSPERDERDNRRSTSRVSFVSSDSESEPDLPSRRYGRTASRADSPPSGRAPSRSPSADIRLRAPSINGRKRSGSDVSDRSSYDRVNFGGSAGVSYGGSGKASNGQPVSANYGGGISNTYGAQGSNKNGRYSPVSPVSSPELRPQPYGASYSFPVPAPSSGPPSTQTYKPPGLSNYAPKPVPQNGPYSIGGSYQDTLTKPIGSASGPYPSISAPPPLQHTYSSPGPDSGIPGAFTSGDNRPPVQSASTVPSVFQYQTSGPTTVAAPYNGDLSPPPNLDPRYPGPMPGEGAGKVYPPGQAPPQYNNPDYYAPVLSNPTTSQSLNHSIVAAGGLSAAGKPGKQTYGDGPVVGGSAGASSSGKLSDKLGKLTTLGIPTMSGLSLSPSTAAGGSQPLSGGLPPPSPALQPYHGTYQSISPMPSPVFGPSKSPVFSASGSVSLGKHSAQGSFSLGAPAYPKPQSSHQHHQSSTSISSFQDPAHTSQTSLSSSDNYQSRPGINASHSPSRRRRSRSRSSSPSRSRSPSPPPYNPTPDAIAILEELRHTFRRPSPATLIKILPALSPHQLKMLKREYKVQFRSVNLAKHIKSVFTTSTPFGKLVFSVALGPYESEAWFANSWYQKKESRNELLIESLMGKQNWEVAKIKAAFRDAKYGDSLENAVREELGADKFRMAVMAQLGCMRMEEEDPIVRDRVTEDVARLGTIMERSGASGGETEMVGIIVNRSDAWLREVARLYKEVYGRDLAKAVMKHSKNLAGETLLHILAGAVDRPLRDAKLLDQAISSGREDLLISRATRIHWDLKHLRRVKRVFKRKYGVHLGERLRTATSGSYCAFLIAMCRAD